MSAGARALIGGGGPYIRDPRELPVYQLDETVLWIKIGQSTKKQFDATNASAAFTALALRGAQASVAVAGTYVTVANLSGRGRLYNIVLPTNTGAVYTPTARITVDGTVYTIAPSTTLAAANRAVIGALSDLPSTSLAATVGADILLPNAFPDHGFGAASVGGFFTLSAAGIVVPEMMEAYGMPFLQFDTSCLIEFKTSLLASTAADRIGGATYRMLP